MSGRFAKDEAVMITLCLQRRFRALAGHHPVMMGLLLMIGAVIFLGDMSENEKRLTNWVVFVTQLVHIKKIGFEREIFIASVNFQSSF